MASGESSLPPTVVDDFEDGDASDWVFFGGNNAGGGGGVLDDRPREGNYYFSTGWGGQGTASSFYGGAFRNFDNAAQVTPPADPWFNVWVLNQGNATADQFNLEITLREDLNGDGWVDGTEDSMRLDTTFNSAEFNDAWVLVSAPLSSFTNLGTGGDGVFNGNLDEVVIVIAGVAGAAGSVVEVDFDQLSFTSGGPVLSSPLVFDDMEHGDPLGNGWFTFSGIGGGGIDPNDTDLPPSVGGSFSLQTGWASAGVPGFFGGFGRTNPTDLSGTTNFSFWINPDAGQDYTLEINLQDDDNGDGEINPPDDDEFQFNCVISPAGPCAVSGGGWQKVSIPLDDFFYDPSFLSGGNGVFDPVPVANGGNGELISVVLAVIGNSGSDATFRTDYWVFSSGDQAEPSLVIDDFESGLLSGFDGNGNPIGFTTFSDGSPIAIATTASPPVPVPGLGSGNNVLAMTGNVTAFAGFIHGFENAAVDTWIPQDWSTYEGLRIWVYGQNTGTTLFIDVLDNRNPGSTSDDAERYTVSFADDFSGWQLFEFPFSSFVRKEVGNGAPNDGFTLTDVHGYALGTLSTGGEVTYYVDNVELVGPANDSDGDGVVDSGDLCPESVSGDPVDMNGCSDIQVDGDGDGACDPGAMSNGPSMCTGTDAFPDDSTETSDNDGDGTGDNADTDDDNDGQSDADEIACGSDPLIASSISPDADNDGIPDCVDTDDDNDGVDDGIDQCENTMIPEAAPTSSRGLGKNRWALIVENSTDFTQAPPQEGSMFSFTTLDTRGCSCSQIVEAAGIGNNHLKRGCSTSVMLNWINNP
jgi:hypothetical protein